MTRRLLLDTHALVWAINEPEQLGSTACARIRDASNPLLVSAASAWEIATKHRIGKLPDAGPWLDTLGEHIDRLGAEELPISLAHARAAGFLDWGHRDPFDRILAVQAMQEGLTLVTKDHVFRTLGGLDVVW